MKTYFNIIDGTLTKCVERDMTLYPATNEGDQALLDAINKGLVAPIRNRPVNEAIVGTLRADPVESRTDYRGVAVVKSAAPTLFTLANRTIPRPTGNNFPFAVQLAQNTVKWERIPAFTTHPKKVIIYPGGLYLTMADNGLLGRGFTHLSESPKWNGPIYPAQFKRAIESAFYNAARDAALLLPEGNSDRAQLLAWAGPYPTYEGTHVLLTSDTAARLYARKWVDIFFQDDWKGGGVEYFSVNHEIYQGSYSGYIVHVGLMTRAILDEMNSRGYPNVKAGLSDHGDLCTYATYIYDQPASTDKDGGAINNPDASIPQYMHVHTIMEPFRGTSQSAPMGESSILATLVKQGRAYVGVGSYLQHTMDDESYFQKNTDGSYKLDSDSNPIWRTDERTTTVAGQPVTIYEGDYRLAMIKYYNILARYCADMFIRAGSKHLPKVTDRQAGWETMLGRSRSYRLDGESESGLPRADHDAINQRALNPDQVEADAIKMYIFCDYMRGWMNTQQPTNLGSNRGAGILSTSRASAEQMAKGFYRAAQFNWFLDLPWQLMQPKFWIWKAGISGTADPKHHFARKPEIQLFKATYQGKVAVLVYGEYPCQDVDKTTEVILWGDDGDGFITPGYQVLLVGRQAFLECYFLPEGAQVLEPGDFYAQFTGIAGGKQTWQFDYRKAEITNHPTPPTVIEIPTDVTVTPVPEPVDTLFIDRIRRRYDGTNLFYDIKMSVPGLDCQVRNRQRTGVLTEWFPPVGHTDAAMLAAGYTHYWYANLGGAGTSTLVEFRISAEDLNVISIPYVIPSAPDSGSIVYSNDPSNPALWQIDN